MLFVPGTIGSSSASAVLLELVHAGHAPAALVLHEPDAILLLGLIVAREMGWQTPIAVKLDRALHSGFAGPAAWRCRRHDGQRGESKMLKSGSAGRGPAGDGRR